MQDMGLVGSARDLEGVKALGLWPEGGEMRLVTDHLPQEVKVRCPTLHSTRQQNLNVNWKRIF